MSRYWLAALAMVPALSACSDPKPAGTAPPAAPTVVPTAAPTTAPTPVSNIPAVPAGWKTYSDATTGIAFDYAPDRRTGDCPDIDEGVVCVALFAADAGKGAGVEPLMLFQPIDGTLDSVAKDQAGFEKNEQGVLMTTFGRFEPVPVETFTTRAGPGLKATVVCGIDDENGFHAGAGDCLWGVTGDGTHAVLATTQGRLGLDADTMKSLTSVRFVPKE